MDHYEFIVIGAGPSGCTLASRLARSTKRPQVLLLEAGGSNAERNLRIIGESRTSRANPTLNYGYKTIRQRHLDNREISYDRGRGVGGSSAINTAVWSAGSRDDYERLANVVGDDEWRWGKADARLRQVERFGGIARDHGYMVPFINEAAYGKNGSIGVGFPTEYEYDLTSMLDIFHTIGLPFNEDARSGHPLGLAVAASSAVRGYRSTAADILKCSPSNLTVMTDVHAYRVLLDASKVAYGIETDKGIFRAVQETILCCGTLDTPRILMHSGIGPSDQLKDHDIPLVQDLPVGQNLHDHCATSISFSRTEAASTRPAYLRDKSAQARAREQWDKDQTGPLSVVHCGLGLASLKLPSLFASEESHALNEAARAHLQAPTIPHYLMVVGGAHIPDILEPDKAMPVATIYVFFINNQSVGEARLQSSDPAVPLSFDPKFMSHPYDRRLAIEATRDVSNMCRHEAFIKDTTGVLSAPKDDSDEEILKYVRAKAASFQHMCGTVKMGPSPSHSTSKASANNYPQPTTDASCVDPDFRVHNISRLRVADMSIMPFVPANPTQSTAYLIGLMCGDKMVQQYGLDE